MHLAPLASPLNAVLAGLPLTIAKELDPGAVNKQVQRTIGAAIRDLDGQRFCRRHSVEKSGTGQSNPAKCKRLATIPAVCRSGNLNRILIDRQNWIVEFEKTGGRPGRPSCGASQVISLSNQIRSDPRFLSASL